MKPLGMNNLLGLGAFVAFLFASGDAMANSVDSNIAYVTVDTTTTATTLTIQLTGGVDHCPDHTAARDDYAYLGEGATEFKAVVSIATAASLSGRKVTLTTEWNEATNRCDIQKIQLRPN